MKRIHRKQTVWGAILAGVTVLALSAGLTNADVIYTQNFNNASASNTNVGTITGWSAYLTKTNASALNMTAPASVTSPTPMISGASGGGYLAFNSNATLDTTMSAFVTGLSLDLSNTGVITWNMNGSKTSDNIRLLVQVGGNWYASNSLITVSSGGYDNIPDFTSTFNFSTLASEWRTFSVVEDSAITLGSSTLAQDLSSSLVTGIGFYFNGNGTVRIDSLSVSAIVPEPNAVALLVLAVGVLGFSQRGRRARRS